MEMMERRILSIIDINLASFLSLHGIEPTLKNLNGKIIFLFEADDNLYKLISDFNSNVKTPICDFVTRLKILRGKMFTAKEESGSALNGR